MRKGELTSNILQAKQSPTSPNQNRDPQKRQLGDTVTGRLVRELLGFGDALECVQLGLEGIAVIGADVGRDIEF